MISFKRIVSISLIGLLLNQSTIQLTSFNPIQSQNDLSIESSFDSLFNSLSSVAAISNSIDRKLLQTSDPALTQPVDQTQQPSQPVDQTQTPTQPVDQTQTPVATDPTIIDGTLTNSTLPTGNSTSTSGGSGGSGGSGPPAPPSADDDIEIQDIDEEDSTGKKNQIRAANAAARSTNAANAALRATNAQQVKAKVTDYVTRIRSAANNLNQLRNKWTLDSKGGFLNIETQKNATIDVIRLESRKYNEALHAKLVEVNKTRDSEINTILQQLTSTSTQQLSSLKISGNQLKDVVNSQISTIKSEISHSVDSAKLDSVARHDQLIKMISDLGDLVEQHKAKIKQFAEDESALQTAITDFSNHNNDLAQKDADGLLLIAQTKVLNLKKDASDKATNLLNQASANSVSLQQQTTDATTSVAGHYSVNLNDYKASVSTNQDNINDHIVESSTLITNQYIALQTKLTAGAGDIEATGTKPLSDLIDEFTNYQSFDIFAAASEQDESISTLVDTAGVDDYDLDVGVDPEDGFPDTSSIDDVQSDLQGTLGDTTALVVDEVPNIDADDIAGFSNSTLITIGGLPEAFVFDLNATLSDPSVDTSLVSVQSVQGVTAITSISLTMLNQLASRSADPSTWGGSFTFNSNEIIADLTSNFAAIVPEKLKLPQTSLDAIVAEQNHLNGISQLDSSVSAPAVFDIKTANPTKMQCPVCPIIQQQTCPISSSSSSSLSSSSDPITTPTQNAPTRVESSNPIRQFPSSDTTMQLKNVASTLSSIDADSDNKSSQTRTLSSRTVRTRQVGSLGQPQSSSNNSQLPSSSSSTSSSSSGLSTISIAIIVCIGIASLFVIAFLINRELKKSKISKQNKVLEHEFQNNTYASQLHGSTNLSNQDDDVNVNPVVLSLYDGELLSNPSNLESGDGITTYRSNSAKSLFHSQNNRPHNN